jgi:tRNA(His) 5'-end guanylyltransferase
MVFAAKKLLSEVGGAGLVYVQSDEISILINPYKKFETQQYFGGNVQKISSVSASIATAAFNSTITSWASEINLRGYATFDGRCFVVPREDVSNYFLWRWQDCVRNSVSGLAQAHFSAKQLNGVNQLDMKEKLSNKGIVWENCSAWDKWGTYISSLNDNEVHCEFLDIKPTIEKLLEQEEE